MYAIHLNSDGHNVQIPVPTERTGDFIRTRAEQVEQDLAGKRRTSTRFRCLCLIYDNAPAHKSVLVQEFLEKENGTTSLSL